MADADLYRVEVEVPLHGEEWHYMPILVDAHEELARKFAASVKKAGVGGKLIHLNGSPDGLEVERWPGKVEKTPVDKV